MRRRVQWAAVLAMAASAMAAAAPDTPARALVEVAAPHTAAEFRLERAAGPDDPLFRVNDPRSMLQSGYGGALIDFFPFEGGKFHLSGGGKLFGRAGRPRVAGTELFSPLPPSRAGLLRRHGVGPAMLIGYGRPVERGLALGIDTGLVLGRVGATPDRLRRLNRHRLDPVDGRGRGMPLNQIGRVTALYRF